MSIMMRPKYGKSQNPRQTGAELFFYCFEIIETIAKRWFFLNKILFPNQCK